MKSVKLAIGKYYLKRQRDGAGDSGPKLISRKWPEGKDKAFLEEIKPFGVNGELHLGCSIECGSITARSYSSQDFWLTTNITEFLSVEGPEDCATKVTFKTGNSIYEAGVISSRKETEPVRQAGRK